MHYWSKGLGRRALIIDWSKGATQISVQDGQELLASVIPLHQVRGELPPSGAQVVVAGDTRPPIQWRYISVLGRGDFENILRLVTSPAMVNFLLDTPRGRGLFLKLTRFLVVFSLKYSWACLVGRNSAERACGEVDTALPRTSSQ